MRTVTVDSDKYTLADFQESKTSDPFAKTVPFWGYIHDLKRKDEYSYHRTIESACTNEVFIRDHSTGDIRRMVTLTSNNYLGLCTRTEVLNAACNAVRKYGSGMCGSRFLSGTYDLVEDLEREIAAFEHREDAIVFTTGYQANVGTISALMRKGDIILIDRLCHASIVDGCRMSGADFRAFRHNDADSLDKLLARCASKYKGKLIVVDGIFSMDGDMAPLAEIAELADRYDARLMVDEAHGTGVVGQEGRGASEQFGIEDKVDIVLGTFSKALASTGGFIASSKEVVNYVRHYGRSYMFSASPIPAAVAAAKAALKIVREEPELRERLWDNIRYIYNGLKESGFSVYPEVPSSAILTLTVGPDAVVHAMSKYLYEGGVFTGSVVYPSVSRNEAKIRISVSAIHTRENLDKALAVLRDVGKKYGII